MNMNRRQKEVLVVHLHGLPLSQVTDDGVKAQKHDHEEHLLDLVAEKGVNDVITSECYINTVG